MSTSPTWEQWDGQGYPAEKLNPTIYYFPGTADIERIEERDALATEIHQDGVAPTRRSAHILMENAIVVHGQVVDIEGELHCYFGPKYGIGDGGYEITHDATWVELDEYTD